MSPFRNPRPIVFGDGRECSTPETAFVKGGEKPARIGAFKPVADFDWTWPKRIDRPLIEELFSLAFVDDATNIVLVGPNGVGKSMLIKNLLHHAVLNGFTARFTTASDMLPAPFRKCA